MSENEEMQAESAEMTESEAVEAIDGLLNPKQQPEVEEPEDGELEDEVEAADEEPEEEIEELPIETVADLAEALGADPEDLLAQVKVKIKVDGEEQEVPLGELRNGYQREASYTQKTQKISAKARELENQEEQILQFKQYVQAMGQGNPWQHAEQQLQQEYQSTNWDELEVDDPVEAANRHNRMQRQMQHIGAAKQQHQQQIAQLMQAMNGAEMQVRNQEMAKLAEYTGWAESDIEPKKAELAKALQERGYSEAAIGSLRHASVVADLQKLIELEGKAQTTKNAIETKKAKKVLRVLKSGARKPAAAGANDKYRSLVKRAKKVQSDDAWAAALAEKLHIS